MQQEGIIFNAEDRLLQPDEVKHLATLIINEPDHYTALGVERGASANEINRSYRVAVNYFHLLKYKSDNLPHCALGCAFRRIEQAYFVLSSRSRRKDYDSFLNRRIEPTPVTPRQEEPILRKGNAELWRALSASNRISEAAAPIAQERGLDNRRVARVSMRIPVVVAYENRWQEMAETRDVSPLGIRLAISHPVEPGTLLELEMDMPAHLRTRDFEDEIYRVKAYVLYVTECKGERQVAAEFV